MNERITYEHLKQLKKELKCYMPDLIALSEQNDPFYQGIPANRILAEWFAEIYHQQGWERKRNHIRRCHYQIVSLGITLPSGMPYENTEHCWDTLLIASKAARYLHLVDMASFDDRRNDEPVSYLTHVPEPEVSVYGGGFPGLPDYDIYEYRAQQRYHIEIWCEKTTMNDVLLPLCRRYDAVLQTGAGELSIIASSLFFERVKKYGRPARIFYVSDFDPAGKSMPVATARKIEYFVRDAGLDVDVRLLPIVLTEEQVRRYQLPRTPIKESERRRDRFEQQYGTGAVELDALEALHPGEFERIVRGCVERYYDTDLAAKTSDGRALIERELGLIREQVLERYQQEIQQANQQLEQIENLWHAISDELRSEVPDLDSYPLPEAKQADELGDGLYNSQRDYLEQLNAYKQFQGKEQLDIAKYRKGVR